MIVRCSAGVCSITTYPSSFRPTPGKLRIKNGICFSLRSSSSSSSATDNVLLLSGKEDDHGGVTVEMPTHPIDPILFTSSLKASILHWKQQGKKGVWIKLPIELVNLIEPAVKEGFYFHHAEPKYLMLVHWIPLTANTLPPNASHRVGVGAFVMKQNGEVLVVQEKGGKMRGTGIWKFPTGVVEEGEDICEAAVREVKEETGIDAKFVEILAFRQSHKKFFDKSDLFFMCMLQPVSFDIQKQDREIAAAKWMAFEEYAAQPFVQKHDLPRYIAEICSAKMEQRYTAPAIALMEFDDGLVSVAGYGEEKLSTVVVSGALFCDNTRNSPLPIPGASVAVWCRKDYRKTSKSNWVIRGKTDEYGEFLVDLPSHLHAIPNMEKRCHVTIVGVPKKSPCHRAAAKRKHTAPIRLSSSRDGFRTYSSRRIHLKPSRGRKTYTSHVVIEK